MLHKKKSHCSEKCRVAATRGKNPCSNEDLAQPTVHGIFQARILEW